MTYPEALKYLNSSVNFEKNTSYSYKKDLKLTRIKDLLLSLGNPQDYLRIIHVAGTKGKGSTCAFVTHILREAGFSVGLYTSPHLNDFRERIRILRPTVLRKTSKVKSFEGMISKVDLARLAQELKLVINRYNYRSKHGALTFFEIYTTIAFIYFKRQNVDFVVLETGLGGRLDATNVTSSLVCGIAPISLEHIQILGNTLSKIALEKVGIIKSSKAIVISAQQTKPVQQIINNQCRKVKAQLYKVGKEIKYFKINKSVTIKGLKNEYKNLIVPLLGEHQIANAALAVGLVEGLSFHGFNFKISAIRQGLYNTVWPGRCQLVQKNPLVILDGAQNLASVDVLKKAIQDNFKYRKLILILGLSSDKDIAGICRKLDPFADEIILTCATTSRAAKPSELAKCFKRKLYLTKSVKEAKLLAKRLANKSDLILVTGSLFVVGEF